MDWKKINDECPKAFLEWVKTFQPLAEYVTEVNEVLVVKIKDWMLRRFETNQPSFWQLPEYFDGLQISINPLVVNEHNTCCFVNNEWIKDENGKARTDFLSRRAALEEGVKEAFRIREQQLNNEKV